MFKVVNVLRHMADNVSTLIESFSQLDCTMEFNKVSMYNEVLFFNHIHRFRQSNLTYGNSWASFSESDILPSFEEEQRVPRIVELGAENPRVSPHSVSSTGSQPATKRARIDHQQYQVTATATTPAPRQVPIRTSERHAEYTVQSTMEYPTYSNNHVAQAQYTQNIPQSSHSNQLPNTTPHARQQQVYRNSQAPTQMGGSPVPLRTSPAQHIKVDVPQPTRHEQYDPRSYAEHKVSVSYAPNLVQQAPVELKYSPAISVNVSFNEVPQPRPAHYQLTPAEYYVGGYGAQNVNVQQQQEASYYGNTEPEHNYSQQVYWNPQQQQTPAQLGQQYVKNDESSNEYVNYR